VGVCSKALIYFKEKQEGPLPLGLGKEQLGQNKGPDRFRHRSNRLGGTALLCQQARRVRLDRVRAGRAVQVLQEGGPGEEVLGIMAPRGKLTGGTRLLTYTIHILFRKYNIPCRSEAPACCAARPCYTCVD
jgi:hypothetical protein